MKNKPSKMKVGLVGCGKMGRIREAVIKDRADMELVYTYDPDPDHAIKGYYACQSFEELVKKNDCEIIFLAGYVRDMAEYTIAALKAGKHVFCEKPPARNYGELVRVFEVYQQSEKVLKYGFNHRYHHSVQQAKKIIDGGSLGRAISIRAVYGKAGSIDFQSNWRNYKEYSGGGILIDQGIHILDLMQYLVNQNFKCRDAIIKTQKWDIECEDNAMALLESDGGIMATVHSSATQWKHKFLLEICFEHGYLILDGILSSTMSYAPERLCLGMRASEDIEKSMGQPIESWYTFDDDCSWSLEVEDFANAIANSSEPKNGNIQDSLSIMHLIDEIYRAGTRNA